jgi:protein-S-isoprenylcysteine O-methyltransferase Ste14
MKEHTLDHAEVVAPPPLIYAGALLIGLLLHRAFPIAILPRSIARPVGVILIVINLVIGFPAFFTMRRAHTALNPAHPTTAIVRTGPFRYTRNPIYLSFAILYTGIAMLVNTLWPMLFLPFVLVLVNRGVIAREEQYLEQKFGEEYTQYKTQVRRWL